METIRFNLGYDNFREQLKNITDQHEEKGFMYKLYTEEDGKRRPVFRLAGDDEDGILYIGQTKNLVDRVSLLFRSFATKCPKGKLYKHGADEIYWHCSNARKNYPFKNMLVEITPCENSKVAEFDAIKEYYVTFGEVPPFNGAIVKKKP